MKSNILVIIFLVTYPLNPLNTIKLTEASTSTESSVEQFEDVGSEDSVDPIQIYKNFTDRIFSTISELGENTTTDTNVESYDEDGSLSIASLLGVAYILAGSNDLKLPILYPVFDNIIATTLQWDVLGALDTAIEAMEQTLQCSNIIFVSTSMNLSLEEGNKNSFEIIQVDFDEDDVTVPMINDKIYSLLQTGSIQQNYIPEGLLISSSTQAIIFNIIETKKLKWTSPWSPIGKQTFNKREQVDMLQFEGIVQFIEDESEIQVFILFENQKCGIALRMSNKDMSQVQSVANIEDMDLAASSMSLIQIPELNYTLRSEYNFDHIENTNNCDLNSTSNFLKLLDVLAHKFHLGPEFLEFIVISGAQINNVEQYQEELKRDKDNFPKLSDSKIVKSFKDENPIEYMDMEDGIDESFEAQLKKNTTKKLNEDDQDIKRIIFDRPFTWVFFDDHRVPIVAGVVSSLKTLSAGEDSPAYAYLGMESSTSFPYTQCFGKGKVPKLSTISPTLSPDYDLEGYVS